MQCAPMNPDPPVTSTNSLLIIRLLPSADRTFVCVCGFDWFQTFSATWRWVCSWGAARVLRKRLGILPVDKRFASCSIE